MSNPGGNPLSELMIDNIDAAYQYMLTDPRFYDAISSAIITYLSPSKVFATASGASGSFSTTAPFQYNTIIADPYGTITIGANWSFTSPKSAWYVVSVWSCIRNTGVGNTFIVWVNGAVVTGMFSWGVVENAYSGSALVFIPEGQVMQFFPDGAVSISPGSMAIMEYQDE